MGLPWRKRKGPNNRKKQILIDSDFEITIPSQFRCPISLELMKDPVTLSTGITYDRESIERWIELGNNTCPVTNTVLTTLDQIPNHSIRKMIQEWCVQNRSYGIERIPTPRVPISAHDIGLACSRLADATCRGDQRKCLELVGKIKAWCGDSERNRRSVAENGAGLVLSACFDAFSAGESRGKNVFLLEEVLSVLIWMFPLGPEGQSKLGSTSSLRCMVWFMKSDDLYVRQNAAFLIKQLVSLDARHAHALVDVEGVVEALVKLVNDSINPTATKSSLSAIYHMVSASDTRCDIVSKFINTGLVGILLEMIIDSERSVCEKSLAILDAICDREDGREEMRENALGMPLLVKKLLRVSELATQSSVSIMWKLCRGGGEGGLAEAVRVGAFQKLLVVLQVGCGESTKEKVTELLKMMNVQRGKLESECVDSSNEFKYLKRPF